MMKTLIKSCPITKTNGPRCKWIILKIMIISKIATTINRAKFQQISVHRMKHINPLQSMIDLFMASIADLFSIIMTGIEATRSELMITKAIAILTIMLNKSIFSMSPSEVSISCLMSKAIGSMNVINTMNNEIELTRN